MGACFYREPSFQGDRTCVELTGFTTDVVNLSALGDPASALNDRVASVEVFGKIAVTLYEDEFGQGASAVIMESSPSVSASVARGISSFAIDDVNECDKGSPSLHNLRGRGPRPAPSP